MKKAEPSPPHHAIAIVLAAGRGKRIGGPKALLAWPRDKKAKGEPSGDVPLAIAHAEARLAADCGRVVVVVRRDVANKLLGWVIPGVDMLVSNAEDELGPAGSIAAAAAKLATETKPDDVIVITPVDALPAPAATVAALVARLAEDPSLVAVKPVHGARGGHPVVARAGLLAQFLVPAPAPLRDVLAGLGGAVASVEIADPRVLMDLDTPVDVARALGAPPRFV